MYADIIWQIMHQHTEYLFSFSKADAPVLFTILCTRTKLQSLSCTLKTTNMSINSNAVELIQSYVYLGCYQCSLVWDNSKVALLIHLCWHCRPARWVSEVRLQQTS